METPELGLWAVNVAVYTENDNGKEKKTNHPYLVNATDAKHVVDLIEEEYKGKSNRWKITSIKKSRVIDVLNYSGVQNLSKSNLHDTSLMLKD